MPERKVMPFEVYTQQTGLNLLSKPKKVVPRMRSVNEPLCDRCIAHGQCQFREAWEKGNWYRYQTIEYRNFADEVFANLKKASANYKDKGCQNVDKILEDQ